eukprot:Nitzschia sp. Nitz4//scaffold42_size132992//65147//65943//NITZ4_003396-RA/size132992-augustus-gene-0.104-mRNA-1//1//CDS//3329551709//4854//frame0
MSTPSSPQDATPTEPPSNSPSTDSTFPFSPEFLEQWKPTIDFLQQPGTALLMAGLPLGVGAYVGFAQHGDKLEEWVGDEPAKQPTAKGKTVPSTTQQPKVPNLNVGGKVIEAESMAARELGVSMAARALGVATLGTFGFFGLIGAAGFYLAGYRSVPEAWNGTRAWASGHRSSFENWLGMDDRESLTHPDVVATKAMSEEEEWNYVYDKLMNEVQEDDKVDTSNTTTQTPTK